MSVNLDILCENVAADSVDLIHLSSPRRPKSRETASIGIYTPEHRYRHVQILTIEDILSGVQADYPRFAPEAALPHAAAAPPQPNPASREPDARDISSESSQ